MKKYLFCLLVLCAGSCFAERPVLLFDFGGVITHVDRGRLIEGFGQDTGLEHDEVLMCFKGLRKAIQQGAFEDSPEGELAYFERFFSQQQRILPADFAESWRQLKLRSVVEIPGMLDFIDLLKEQGYQVAMLSNVDAHRAELVRELGYYAHFGPCILSYEIGAEKPSALSYQIALEALGVPAAEVIMIDDKSENIEAAIGQGMQGIHFTDYSAFVLALEQKLSAS